jgi:glucokinase
MANILAADIGGTNCRFGRFAAGEDGKLLLVETTWLKTKDADSFGQLIEHLRASGFSLKPEDADIFVIAIAGPVEQGSRSSPPLISWDIDLSEAERDFGFRRFALINDFVAQAFSCLSPVAEAAKKILQGQAVAGAATAVVGAGTGFGKAALLPDGKGSYIVAPSEGGHANFPFVSKREFEFQEFLLSETGEGYITANTVVSGRGLSYVHQFLTGEKLEPSEVAERLSKNPETLMWTARFYGRVCRNYALETLSLGGLYVAGGVAARTPELVMHKAFESEFRSSDTLAALLERIPVSLITDENSGLWGAAVYGLQHQRMEGRHGE